MCDSLYQAIATVTGCRVGSGPLGFRLEPLVRGQAVQQTRETLCIRIFTWTRCIETRVCRDRPGVRKAQEAPRRTVHMGGRPFGA